MRFIPLCSLLRLPSVFTHCPSSHLPGHPWLSSSPKVSLKAQSVFQTPLLSAWNNSHLGVCRAGPEFQGKWPCEGEHTSEEGCEFSALPLLHILKTHLACSPSVKTQAFYLNLYLRVDHRDCVWNLAFPPSGWDTATTGHDPDFVI